MARPQKKRQRIAIDGSNPNSALLSLPDHLLELLVARLDLREHICFGAVCKHLRKLAMIDNPPSSKSLCLVPTYDARDLLRRFLSPPPPSYALRRRDSRLRKTRINCLGLFQGWLVIEENRGRFYLFNRVLRLRIRLPKLPGGGYIERAVLSADPLSDDCVVAAVHSSFCVSICEPRRRNEWRGIYDAWGADRNPREVHDLVFHGERLWAIVLDNRCLYAVDLFDDKPPVTLLEKSPSGPHDLSASFLLEWEDKLLVASMDPESLLFHLWEYRNSVFVEASDLEGRALLLRLRGMDEAFPGISVDARENKCFEKNCIYFMYCGNRGFVYRYCPAIGKFVPEDRIDAGDLDMPSYYGLFLYE